MGQRLGRLLEAWETELFVPERIWREHQVQLRESQEDTEEIRLQPMLPDSHTWLAGNWKVYQGFVFVSAVGIAVRLIAPCLRDKLSDPAVVALDEKACFSIPLAAGHVGGANQLAGSIAALLGAVPVITTATDVEHKFAADLFAKQNGIPIRGQDRRAVKNISAAILEEKPVGLYCEYEICGAVPKELTVVKRQEEIACFSACIVIPKTDETALAAEQRNLPEDPGYGGTILRLVPRDVILGIGCRKGMSSERIQKAIQEALRSCKISVNRLDAVASIALKAGEPGIQEAAGQLGLPFITYPAECLSGITGVSRESDFVRTVTGIGNVCERAAIFWALQEMERETKFCGSAEERQREIEILLPKTIYEGITLAAVRKKWSVHFE